MLKTTPFVPDSHVDASSSSRIAPQDRRVLSETELAQLWGVSAKTLQRWRTEGRGPRGIRVGRHVRFRRTDVDAWLDSHADERSR